MTKSVYIIWISVHWIISVHWTLCQPPQLTAEQMEQLKGLNLSSLESATKKPRPFIVEVATVEGPRHYGKYNPHFGYEPYWKDGAWVWDPPPPLKENNTLCDRPCSPLYSMYGVICGGHMHHREQQLTFKNYCEMKSLNCDGEMEFMMLHRGPCQGALPTIFNPLVNKDKDNKVIVIIDRAQKFVARFEKQSLTTISGRKLQAMKKYLDSLKTTKMASPANVTKQARGPKG